jgi:hypothetical protein
MLDLSSTPTPVKDIAGRTPATRLSPLQDRKLVDLIEGLDAALDAIAMAAMEVTGNAERSLLLVADTAINNAIEFLTETRLNSHS